MVHKIAKKDFNIKNFKKDLNLKNKSEVKCFDAKFLHFLSFKINFFFF